MSRDHYTDYNEAATGRCERALLTLIGDLGPWRERIYLAGGLAPRYLVGQLPEGVPAHVGTTDVDLVIGLALGDETPETYRTLENNLEKALFEQQEPSFRWARQVEGVTVLVEFLCETDEVPSGRIYKPKGEYTGSKPAPSTSAAPISSATTSSNRLSRESPLMAEANHGVFVRVANVLPYTVLKIFAFQDRHENKDAYDLVFTLLNHQDGPRGAGRLCAACPVAQHPQVVEALLLLKERFRDANQDGPNAYASFLANPADEEKKARLRQQAVATVRAFLSGLRNPTARSPVGDRQSET